MQSLFFWKDWSRPFKFLYLVLFIIFCAVVAWMLYAHFTGTEIFINWNILGETKKTDAIINTFKLGPFSLTVSAENTIFYQRFEGSAPIIHVLSYYVFLIITVVAANILLTIITTLSRFWFYVGMAFFAIFLVNLKLELLLLFDTDWKIGLIVPLILFLPTSYYFNVINPGISFIRRLGVFTLLTIGIAVLIHFSAGLSYPFFYIATSGIINPIIISLIFILLIAHEIINWMVYIITNANTPSSKNTLSHFIVLIVIYMTNLILVYFHETNKIDWDIIYVDLFFLLLISTVLGIWGYKQREEQYDYLFKFAPIGAIFYITMAICCMGSIAHLLTTGNDVALEIFRDATIYGHIGFGVIFILYVIANFITPLKDNLKVYKVMYKPTSMPYFIFRFAGIIAVTALFLNSGWRIPINQSIAGYYNALGDLHWQNEEQLLAQQYYKEGAIYGYNNHKSNYTLGYINDLQGNTEKAIEHYEKATKKSPSPQAFINLSNLNNEENKFFWAFLPLQEGLKQFPNEHEIQNNIALLYGKTDILDTTVIYLDKAYHNSDGKVAASNILAIVAKNNVDIKADTVLSDYNIARDPISINNRIVLSNNSREASDIDFTPSDSTLSLLEASILYNNAFNALFQEDSLVTEDIYKYANRAANVNFREPLQYVLSLNHYKNLQVNKAFRRLNWLANRISENSGKYFNHVGLWALEQNVPNVAIDHFKWALEEGFEEARLHLAIALTENQDREEAIEIWNSLAKSDDVNLKTMAVNLISLLQLDDENLGDLTDNQKYLYLRYHIGVNDTSSFNAIFPTISDNDYRAEAILNMAEKMWVADRSESAINYYTELADLQIADRALFEKIQWFELKLLAAQGNVRGLAQKINQGIDFKGAREIEKRQYTGLLNEASGDTVNARLNYEFIAYKNPFKEEAIIAAANFLGIRDKFEAYNILLSALEINPESIRLLKAYILQCARVQSAEYAENSFEVLGRIISSDELQKFRNEYNELLEVVEESEDEF